MQYGVRNRLAFQKSAKYKQKDAVKLLIKFVDTFSMHSDFIRIYEKAEEVVSTVQHGGRSPSW